METAKSVELLALFYDCHARNFSDSNSLSHHYLKLVCFFINDSCLHSLSLVF